MMRDDPWRLVVGEPRLREGRGGLMGGDTFRRTRWWDLLLECGHTVERTVKYQPYPGGNRTHRPRRRDAVMPPPKRVRCEGCGD